MAATAIGFAHEGDDLGQTFEVDLGLFWQDVTLGLKK